MKANHKCAFLPCRRYWSTLFIQIFEICTLNTLLLYLIQKKILLFN